MTSGIPYFPLEVHLDDKFDLIEAEFGLTGFAVVVKLFQKIYGGQGYYCEWTNDVALLFGKKIGLGGNAVSEIVSAAIKRGIFDKDLYDKYHILTSAGVQERHLEAVRRRVEVNVKKEYLLVQVDKKYKNVNILSKNVYISGENVNSFKQRKEKKSKVKKSKEEESNTAALTSIPPKLIAFYEENISRNFITPYEAESISHWLEKVDADVIRWAMEQAVAYKKPVWKYIEKILSTHYNAGRTTLEAVKDASNSFQNGNSHNRTTTTEGISEIEQAFMEAYTR